MGHSGASRKELGTAEAMFSRPLIRSADSSTACATYATSVTLMPLECKHLHYIEPVCFIVFALTQ